MPLGSDCVSTWDSRCAARRPTLVRSARRFVEQRSSRSKKRTFQTAKHGVRSRTCFIDTRSIQHQELALKHASLATALVVSFAFVHAAAHAEGCTKGAVVGGVGGHIAGGHGVAGAAAGCAIGHHEAKKKDKAASAAAAASQPAGK
jgi:hypothetical protein